MARRISELFNILKNVLGNHQNEEIREAVVNSLTELELDPDVERLNPETVVVIFGRKDADKWMTVVEDELLELIKSMFGTLLSSRGPFGSQRTSSQGRDTYTTNERMQSLSLSVLSWQLESNLNQLLCSWPVIDHVRNNLQRMLKR